jgi:import inner membrane translocase subunit TIM44
VLSERCLYSSRLFASSSQDNPTATTTTTAKKKDLRESIERLKGESKDNNGAEGASSTSNIDDGNNPYVEKLSTIGSSFLDTLSQTWEDLITSGQAKDINKKIGTVHPTNSDGTTAPNYANDDAAADKYESYAGSRDIMLIDPIEQLTAWERMQRRLRDTPIISNILDRTERVYEESGAKTHITNTSQKIQSIKEDAAEAWETSQNPWVYRASSVYDTLTAESEFAIASRQLQLLDPDFTLENWKRDVVDYTLPKIMKLFLEGRITELKPWLGEAVYNRLAAEVRARKKEGVQMDTNVLAIMNAEILACEVEGSSVNVERGSDPIILLHFMCQQIHCVRKKVVVTTTSNTSDSSSSSKEKEKGTNNEDVKEEVDEGKTGSSSSSSSRTYMDEELGDIVEGSEDDIRANSYVVAFQREYNEEKMELNWKIVDFRFNGAIAYL